MAQELEQVVEILKIERSVAGFSLAVLAGLIVTIITPRLFDKPYYNILKREERIQEGYEATEDSIYHKINNK